MDGEFWGGLAASNDDFEGRKVLLDEGDESAPHNTLRIIQNHNYRSLLPPDPIYHCLYSHLSTVNINTL